MNKEPFFSTIDYYNDNADEYIKTTKEISLELIYNVFLSEIPCKASILDVGCGSGRDSIYFIKKGYNVTAIDGSIKICERASRIIGQKVLNINILDIDYNNQFDGVWACASLLHIPSALLPEVLHKINCSLKKDGVLYASWKYGEKEEIRNGRFYCDMTEKKILEALSNCRDLELKKIWLSKDTLNRSEDYNWLNVIIKRSAISISG